MDIVPYLVLFAVVLGVNLLPAFGPPTWKIIVLYGLNSHLPPWAIVLVGALAAASGRFALANGFRLLAHHVADKTKANLNAAREALERNKRSGLIGLGLFALSPLPSAQLFEAAGLTGVRLLPFTGKADLRENYPFGMFAVPRTQVVRVHASSGTTGAPTVVGYTQQDVDTWADLVARSLRAAGVRPGDVCHVAYGYGLFTGGLGAHYGAERLGCTVIPMSGGQTTKQVQLLRDFGAIVALTVAIALISAITVLPPVLIWADKHGWVTLGRGARPVDEGLSVEERAAAGVVMMDAPSVKRNQAESYRAVVKALELEIATGKPHCSCCLKPTGGPRSGIFR